MFHPVLADGLPCVGGRRCLRHTWDEAPGCDVWFGLVSAVIGLLLGGGVAPKLGSCVDLKGASFAGVIPGCCAPVGSSFVGTHSHSHRYLQGLGDSRRAMQCRSATSACIVGLDGVWATLAHHAQVRPLPSRKQQGFGHKA